MDTSKDNYTFYIELAKLIKDYPDVLRYTTAVKWFDFLDCTLYRAFHVYDLDIVRYLSSP